MLRVRVIAILFLVIGLMSSSLFGEAENVSITSQSNKIFKDVQNGDISSVIGDLLMGLDMNARDEKGNTPLMLSIISRKDSITQYLLARGANLTARNIDGDTALLLGVAAGNLQILSRIQARLRNFDEFNDNGEGILEVSIRNQHYDILKYLLDQELIDVNRPNPLGFTVLGFATLLQDMQAVKILLQYRPVNKDGRAGDTGKTPLMIASMLGDMPILNVLLDVGADKNLLDRYGRTALGIAADSSRDDAAVLLIDKGSKIDTVDIFGQTPLTLSIANGLDGVATLLIKKGIDINEGNDICGETPLMEAAAFGRLSLLKFMVESAKGNLRKVLENDCLEITSRDPYRAVQYKKGWNALDIAEESMQVDVVNYLVFNLKMQFNKSLSPERLDQLGDEQAS